MSKNIITNILILELIKIFYCPMALYLNCHPIKSIHLQKTKGIHGCFYLNYYSIMRAQTYRKQEVLLFS